jgi:hypothetical protein
MNNFLQFFQTIVKNSGFPVDVLNDQSFLPLEMGFRIIYPSTWNLMEAQRASTHIMLLCLISCVSSGRYDFGISDWFLRDSIECFITEVKKELLLWYSI